MHGPPIGYVGIGIGAFASWIGLIGAGEAALVTGAIFAARNRLDITQVVVIAWAAAYVGGIVGWAIGRRVGAVLASAPGPFLRARQKAVTAGERFFERYGPLAVLFTPSWVAGLNQVRAHLYLPVSAVAAALWVAMFGLGTYFIGPEVAEYAGDLGTIGSIAIGLALAAAGTATMIRRRRVSGTR